MCDLSIQSIQSEKNAVTTFFFLRQRPTPAPICCECLGTERANQQGEPEELISDPSCGTSVHPKCRVYSAELVAHFKSVGWTCDDCKVCLVCAKTQTKVGPPFNL